MLGSYLKIRTINLNENRVITFYNFLKNIVVSYRKPY